MVDHTVSTFTTSTYRPVAKASTCNNIHHSQQTNKYASGGIQTRNPNKRRPHNYSLDRAITGIRKLYLLFASPALKIRYYSRHYCFQINFNITSNRFVSESIPDKTNCNLNRNSGINIAVMRNEGNLRSVKTGTYKSMRGSEKTCYRI